MRERKINGIQHITIISNDLEVTDKFYTEVMGFVKIDRPDLGFDGSWYMINNNNAQQLHVIEDKGYMPDMDHVEDIYPVGFEAEGYGEMITHLRDCNVEFRFEEIGYKCKQMKVFFYDPSGVLIELNYKKSSEWI
tara:strand:+ start:1192 stop:1596 length:405 start_codon:yes stop_codon:yes gene_type:complete